MRMPSVSSSSTVAGADSATACAATSIAHAGHSHSQLVDGLLECAAHDLVRAEQTIASFLQRSAICCASGVTPASEVGEHPFAQRLGVGDQLTAVRLRRFDFRQRRCLPPRSRWRMASVSASVRIALACSFAAATTRSASSWARVRIDAAASRAVANARGSPPRAARSAGSRRARRGPSRAARRRPARRSSMRCARSSRARLQRARADRRAPRRCRNRGTSSRTCVERGRRRRWALVWITTTPIRHCGQRTAQHSRRGAMRPFRRAPCAVAVTDSLHEPRADRDRRPRRHHHPRRP